MIVLISASFLTFFTDNSFQCIFIISEFIQVNDAVEENDYEAALSSSRKVKNFCIGVLLTYIGMLAVAGALLAVYFITGKIL